MGLGALNGHAKDGGEEAVLLRWDPRGVSLEK